jgi:transcriptional regulator with XRE-family HTH domain
VACPDGLHRIDLIVMRVAMTRMVVAGELNQIMADLARKAGMSRSTVSRIFNGRLASLPTLVRLLAVLALTFDQVVEQQAISSQGPGPEDGPR